MTPTKWRVDLEFFRRQMPLTHGNLFHTMTPDEFNGAIDTLEIQLPGLTSDQVKAEVMRIVSMVNDGHTRVREETLGNHMFPLRLRFFADGLYVEAADQAHADIVGGKVKRIGNMTAEDAYRDVRPLLSVDRDNEARRKYLAPDLLVTPEVLHAVGVTDTSSSAVFTVEKNHQEIAADMIAGTFRVRNTHGAPVNPEGWFDARDAAHRPVPLWLQHTDKNYWHQYLPNRTLYVQYNQVQDAGDTEPIDRYFPALLREASRRKIERLILDLRLNGGGNNELNRPIWHAILKNDLINRKGRLWVIIGPGTFSAAMNFVDDLELNTNATFVGEPTGESPNMWGDPADVILPNSGIVIRVSTLWWQFEDPRDRRPFRTPDLPAPLRFEDYARNIDPAIRVIGQLPPK